MVKLWSIIVFQLLSISLFAQNEAYLKQENGLYNNAFTSQIGENNLITGFSDIEKSAYQYSQGTGFNDIQIEQISAMYGKNSVLLYQSASANNIAHFTQNNGLHTIMLQETSTLGSNETHIAQLSGSGFINLEREAFLNNIIPSSTNTKMTNPLGYEGIYQEGWGNVIAGAWEISVPFLGKMALFRLDLPAKQISHAGGNWLEIWQSGNVNWVGLYQEGQDENTALIHQSNGFNLAVAYQKNLGGSNYLMIEQTGGMYANVYQSSMGGENRAIIVQK